MEIARFFGQAMIGDEAMMELVVEKSLEHWKYTNSSDIVLVTLQLIRVSHARRIDLAVKIFDAIYDYSKSFYVLFYDAIFSERAIDKPPDLQLYEWYLKIGSVRSYVFQNEIVPTIDVPEAGYTLAAHAALRGRSEVLLLFLRFGADPEKTAKCLTPYFKILTPKWKEILGLILRALPYPTSNVLNMDPNVAPVPRLKHICKTAVRRCLASLAALPSGIYDLSIPSEVKEYVDLLRED